MLDKHDDRVKTCLILLTQVALYLFVFNPSITYFITAALSLYLLSNDDQRKYLRILFRDVSGIFAVLQIGLAVKSTKTIPQRFQEVCAKHPDKVMIYFKDNEWTFREVDEFSNRIANYLKEQGICEGDNVALFMETCEEYVPIWLGILKLGASASLINHNLRDKPLIHCLTTVPSTAIIFGKDLEKGIEEIQDSLSGIRLYSSCFRYSSASGSLGKFIDLKAALKNTSKLPHSMLKKTTSSAKALYVFTSGTTGMPKAAVFSHDRFTVMATSINKYVGLQRDDVLYVPLPLYHTNGITIGVGQAVLWGNSVALRQKFSTTSFWSECIRYNCTVFIYIGEICRYLLAAPPSSENYQHKIRLIIGNGLRPHIWHNFVRRFRIPDVAEFYGSSEGIGSLMNNEGRVGSVGYKFCLLSALSPFQLVKVDTDNEEPIRNADGRCKKVSLPGEPGMHVARIRNIPGQRFEGYADTTATNKKIIANVFEEGDQYYVSGDLFTFDSEGYLYFHDRTGDTFRWKGENVSTTEVEQILSEITFLKDTAVYGVKVMEAEGKAGMAAIADPNHSLNLLDLQNGIRKRLPKYARPLFLRLTKEIPLTNTFKIKKKQFKDEGFNVNVIQDELFFYEQSSESYVPLSRDCYNRIARGEITL